MIAQSAERRSPRARRPATAAVKTSRASYARGDQASTASRSASVTVRRCSGCGVSVMGPREDQAVSGAGVRVRRGLHGDGWANDPSWMHPMLPVEGNLQ